MSVGTARLGRGRAIVVYVVLCDEFREGELVSRELDVLRAFGAPDFECQRRWLAAACGYVHVCESVFVEVYILSVRVLCVSMCENV